MFESFDERIAELQKQYHAMESQRDDAWKAVRAYNKDEEIARRDARNEYLHQHALLIMSDNELAAQCDFTRKHYQLHNGGHFKNGGNTYIYELTATGIGTGIKITCPICGETQDITDYSSW